MNDTGRRLGMTRVAAIGVVVVSILLSGIIGHGQSSGTTAVIDENADGPTTLPEGVVWETNNDDPPIGSPDALRGGTFNYLMSSVPADLSSDGSQLQRRLCRVESFVHDELSPRGPTPGDRPIHPPHGHALVGTDDQQTIYFRLDPDARFSDGEPITADDYVFTWQMMLSDHIVDPFYTNYAMQYFESVDAIDDYTLRIVGTRPSWRPLSDYGLWPTPSHAVVLDADWVTRTNNEYQTTVGPYVVSEVSRGESVTFDRLDDWWGDGKHYFQGLYNFDRIHLRVIAPERALDYLRRGEIDMFPENTARSWNEEYTFPAVRNGWLRRARVFVDMPSGVSGLHMNLEAPIFQNKDFRKAMQYLFNFERLNRNLMYDEYFRQVSFFEGTEYSSPNVKSYPFDPGKAREHLERAGYRRPEAVMRHTLLSGVRNALRGLIFTRADTDDILVNQHGEKASFDIIYGSKGLERHLTVMQQEYRRAGVDVRLRLLEPGTAFERGLDRKYEMTMTGRTTAYYPAPRQYLHTDFKATTNNNNIWGLAPRRSMSSFESTKRTWMPSAAWTRPIASTRSCTRRRSIFRSGRHRISGSPTGTTCSSQSSTCPSERSN